MSNQNLNFRGGATQSMPLKPDIDQTITESLLSGVTVNVRVRRWGKMVNISGTVTSTLTDYVSESIFKGVDKTCLLPSNHRFYAWDNSGVLVYSPSVILTGDGIAVFYSLKGGSTANLNETYFLD